MTTRGPNNIFSGEPLPLAPDIKDPETAAFVRNLLDYLRRLTGKLARFVATDGTGAVPCFAANLITDQVGGVSSLIIPWEHVIHQDSTVYQFTAPSTSITILKAGTYSIEIDVTLSKNVPHKITVEVNGTVPTYGLARVEPANANLSYSFMVPVNCGINDVITVTIDNFNFNAPTAKATGTRLLISKIGVSV